MIEVLVGNGKRKKGAEELKWESLSIEELRALAMTPMLFKDKRIFVLRGALSGERGAALLDIAKVLVESPHLFVFEEEKILAEPKRTLEKAGATVTTAKPELKKERRFDEFGVTAALGSRDRKKVWMGLMLALRAGEKPEALAGLLAWKARQMKDVALSRELIQIYHDSHRGAGSLELLLERFALKL